MSTLSIASLVNKADKKIARKEAREKQAQQDQKERFDTLRSKYQTEINAMDNADLEKALDQAKISHDNCITTFVLVAIAAMLVIGLVGLSTLPRWVVIVIGCAFLVFFAIIITRLINLTNISELLAQEISHRKFKAACEDESYRFDRFPQW